VLFLAAFVAVGWLTADSGALASAGPRIGLIARLCGFALFGWIAFQFLHRPARSLDHLGALAESTARLAATTERLAQVLERSAVTAVPDPAALPVPSPESPATSPAESRTAALAEVRLAIKRGDWALAETLIVSFTDQYRDDRASDQLGDELRMARQAATTTLRARLEAAREANDADRVLELREALAPLLERDELAPLERGLARWFMGLIQKRLRQGAITVDMVNFATRVAGALDTTPEGASLRAALPTLRRSVGLCARCGKPYTGLADACPACLISGSCQDSQSSGMPQLDQTPSVG
jgi:hypothetical protein